MTSEPLLDTDHLARATFDDRELEAELLDLFRDQCRRLAPLLASDRPAPERRDGAHTLKGAARAIGAARLAAALEAVEGALTTHENEADAARSALAGFAGALAPTLAAIEARRAA
jgi:HPt (histidine-containing phosphotransfer) domain-containing protein